MDRTGEIFCMNGQRQLKFHETEVDQKSKLTCKTGFPQKRLSQNDFYLNFFETPIIRRSRSGEGPEKRAEKE